MGVEFVPGGECVPLTGPALVAQPGPAPVTGPGLLRVELGPAERTASQPEFPGQEDPPSPGQLPAVEGREEVAASQVESQLRHREETLTAVWADLTAEHLLAVVPALVNLQTGGGLRHGVTKLTWQRI